MYETPITGEPDFESLQQMKNEIKANAQSVPSTLGGGNHGMLGLVLTPVEYALVSAVPFVTEPHPGPLVFPAGTTGVQSKAIEVEHKTRMKLYEKCVGVEKSIIQQISKAVEKTWLDPLRDHNTDAINCSIPDILAFLFQEHGDVSANALERREKLVRDMVYNPASELVDRIFTEVTKLADFATAAGAPLTQQQKINIAYVILMKTRVFNKAITDWNRVIRVTPGDNTWQNFKRFFRLAHCELKEVGEVQAMDTPFNQANFVCQVVDAIQESLATKNESSEAPPVPSPSANAARSNQGSNSNANVQTIDPNLNALIQQMMTMNSNLISAINGNNSDGGGSNNSNNNRNRNRRRNNRNQRTITMRYCWSCGWCTHDGAHCRVKKNGHKEEATVDNRMGGSENGLPPGYA